ncbi:hypothetical protein Bca4012_093170 [Brassica carinata]
MPHQGHIAVSTRRLMQGKVTFTTKYLGWSPKTLRIHQQLHFLEAMQRLFSMFLEMSPGMFLRRWKVSVRRATEGDACDLGADQEDTCATVVLSEVLCEMENSAAGKVTLLVHHETLDGRAKTKELGELLGDFNDHEVLPSVERRSHVGPHVRVLSQELFSKEFDFRLPAPGRSTASRLTKGGVKFLAPSAKKHQRTVSSFTCVHCNNTNVVSVLGLFDGFDWEVTNLHNISAYEAGHLLPYGGGASCDDSSSLSPFPTVNCFFSDQIQSKSALRERYILVLRLCGRACVAGEAKLPSDPIAEEEAMAGVGPMTQDWEPVVIRKKTPNAAAKRDEKTVNAARRSGAEIESVRKHNAGTNKAASSGTSLNTKRLDDDTENLAHERVPTELKKAIMQARGEKKLTQSQLAQVHYFLSSLCFCSFL